MQQDRKILAVIPARGGSKRIPHKNVKDFLGKPLISYSIEAARNSGLFSDIIVSTDDPEIAAVSRDSGAAVPFMRDANLADDFTGTHAVTADAHERMRRLKGEYDAVCTVYATAPLLTADLLRLAGERFLEQHADYLYACCEFPFPIQRGCYLDESGAPVPVMPECMSMRSQDLPKAYQDAGQFYFFSPRYLEHILHKRPGLPDPFIARVFEMPRSRVIDIDTEDDWNYALLLARALRLAQDEERTRQDRDRDRDQDRTRHAARNTGDPRHA